MGDWNTLHVFDDRRFHEETVPRLRGRKGSLEEHYTRYLRTCPRGECDLGIAEIIEISRQFSEDFTSHPGYSTDTGQGGERNFIGSQPWEYHYRRFFEFIVFAECASFYPYFRMGKLFFRGAVDVRPGATAVGGLLARVVDGYRDNPWTWDGDGIRGWLSATEAKVLNDADSIIPTESEYARYVEEFRRFLDVVTKNDLGLLSAVNLAEARLSGSPSPIDNEKLWKGVELEELMGREPPKLA